MTAVTDIIDELNDSSLSSTRLRELCLQLRKKTDTGCAITVSDEVNLIESLSYHSISPGVDIQINTDVLQTYRLLLSA